uniref:Oligomycin sensitivity conferral protein n=1 Tax=Rhinopithecus bieti TaxID=61621 RepID=A0A2K6KTU9_RHIBE
MAATVENTVSRLSLQVQCFSTSVPVRPPVQVYSIEGLYVMALHSAASNQNKLEQVEKELLRIAQILKEPKVAASILNPYVNLNDITAKETFSSFMTPINLLAEHGHLSNTQGVVSAFSIMMSVHHGEVPCTVTTASPLEEATLSELKTVLKRFLSQGQVLKLEGKTDLSIIGGMIVCIGKKYVDMSAKTKIQKLSRAMRDVV